MDLLDAKAQISVLGQKHAESDDKDAELHEVDAESLLLDFLLGNDIAVPGINLDSLKVEEPDPDWHDTLWAFVNALGTRKIKRETVDPSFIQLLTHYIESFGWIEQVDL